MRSHSTSPDCRLCANTTSRVLTKRILSKFDVDYFLCDRCDLLQTEQPYWLQEAYSESIAALDVGAITRVLSSGDLTRFLIFLLGRSRFRKCLDFGGGAGTFTRRMRDLGFPFFWRDKFCPNIYAKGFEGSLTDHNDLITCFEVFEHLEEVRLELDAIFARRSPFLLVGTRLRFGVPQDWWYYATETGQHIAFYSPQTMEWIAKKHGYVVCAGLSYTLFVRSDIGLSSIKKRMVRLFLNRPHWAARIGAVWAWLSPVASLAPNDVEYLRADVYGSAGSSLRTATHA